MKYYSDVTQLVYDTEEECMKAEKAEKERVDKEKLKKEQEAHDRKVAADKVTAARLAYNDAYKAYRAALNDFCEKYGAYHTTITSKKDEKNTLNDVFSFLFDLI